MKLSSKYTNQLINALTYIHDLLRKKDEILALLQKINTPTKENLEFVNRTVNEYVVAQGQLASIKEFDHPNYGIMQTGLKEIRLEINKAKTKMRIGLDRHIESVLDESSQLTENNKIMEAEAIKAKIISFQDIAKQLNYTAGIEKARNIGNPIQKCRPKKEYAQPHVISNLEEIISVKQHHNPGLVDIKDYFKRQEVVGEDHNTILLTLAMLSSLGVGLLGSSSSGKTRLAEAFLTLLPKEMVYSLGLASDKALFYDEARVNEARFVYLPEIQKFTGEKKLNALEILKNFGEKKDVKRIVADNSNKPTFTQVLNGNKTVLFTLADENSFKLDSELSRRYLLLRTDESMEQTKKIIDHSTRTGSNGMGSNELLSFKSHILNCINLGQADYFSPFREYMKHIFPLTVIQIRTYKDHYYNLVNASARYLYPNRVKQGRKIMVALEDEYNIYALYRDLLYDTLLLFNSSIDAKEEISGLRKVELNWQECFESGLEVMRSEYPGSAEPWLRSQMKDGSISVYNPVIDEKVVVASLNDMNLFHNS